MAGWAEMNASSRGGAVAAVAIVLALVGWALWTGPEAVPAEGGEAAVAPASVAAPDAADETAGVSEETAAGETVGGGDQSAADAAAAVSPSAAPPTIDVLRIAPDGMATLAGRAGAGDEISVLVDGANAATVTADSAGQFATVFTLAPSAAARLLSLSARTADGTVVAGAEQVAIAPMPEAAPEAPEVIAEATQEASNEPAAEPEAPAAIKITEAGAEVLQAPGEGAETALAETPVTLDVISYTAEGAVQLGGRGTAGATLRLYLDNAEIASTGVGADGAWSLITADIAPGIYTLRIDQVDANGAVTSRIETPFKRETLEALAAASAATAPETAPETALKAAPAVSGEEPPASPEAVASAQPEAPATELAAGAAPQAAEGAATATTTEAAAPAVDAAPEAAPADVAADTAPAASPAPITVTVQPGFTLWAIARDNLGAGILYVQVFEANRDQIRDPDLIYPGQVLSVPASP